RIGYRSSCPDQFPMSVVHLTMYHRILTPTPTPHPPTTWHSPHTHSTVFAGAQNSRCVNYYQLWCSVWTHRFRLMMFLVRLWWCPRCLFVLSQMFPHRTLLRSRW